MKISIEIDQDDLDQMHLNSSEFIKAIKHQLLNAVVDDEGGIGEEWLSDNIHLSIDFDGVCIHQEKIIASDYEND